MVIQLFSILGLFINNAAVTIYMQVFFVNMFSILLSIYLRVELLSHI